MISCATASNKKELVDRGYVTAKSGLFLRENPGKKSAKVTLVPNGEEVILLDFAKEPEVIDGISARWVHAQYKNFTGWMFSGYLAPEPFAHSIYGSQKNDTLNANDTFEIGNDLNIICPRANDTYCILNQAIVYFNQKYYKKSVRTNTKVLEIDPKNSTALNNRSLAYINLDMYEEAIQDANASLGLNKNDEHAYFHRAYAFMQIKEYKKSKIDYQQVIKLNAQSCISYSSLGWVYLLSGEMEMAKTELLKAIDCNPGDGYAYGNLANYYWSNKQDKYTALQYIEKSLKAGYTNYASYYDEKSDGQFLRNLNETAEFKALLAKYKK